MDLDKEYETFMERLSLFKSITPPDQWQMMKEAFMGGIMVLIDKMKESHANPNIDELTAWWEHIFKQVNDFWMQQRKKMN